MRSTTVIIVLRVIFTTFVPWQLPLSRCQAATVPRGNLVNVLSAGGHFGVLMPPPVKELQNGARDKAAKLGMLQSHMFASVQPRGVIYLAGRFIYKDPAAAKSAYNTLTSEPPGFKLLYRKPLKQAGFPGVEMKSLSTNGIGYGYRRVLSAGESVYLLAVEVPGQRSRSEENSLQNTILVFINSLAVTGSKS